jgi:signal transduction histidine kinase
MEPEPDRLHRPEPTPPVAPRAYDGAPAADAVVRDTQSVLAATVERIRAEAGCEQVCAWALRETGVPYVAAAAFDRAPPRAPTRDDFDALCALVGACDLSARECPAPLGEIAGRLGISAAAPVTAHDGAPLAVLVCAGSDAARPRTLALLDATRKRLTTPLTAARAILRLHALDDAVRRLDRLAALGSLASEIAHEVRNPLVSIKTFLQLLPERRDDPEFAVDFLEVARGELQRMERLLGVVLDQARPADCDDGPTESPVEVSEVMESVVELVRHRAQKRGVALTAKSQPPATGAKISDDGLRQVLLNLTLNALDAAPEGGAVHLSACRSDDGIAIAVADDGPGVPEEIRGRIFEPFFSTRGKGTGGLGLAISRRIVEAAGGRIAIGNASLGGAEFRIWLPD